MELCPASSLRTAQVLEHDPWKCREPQSLVKGCLAGTCGPSSLVSLFTTESSEQPRDIPVVHLGAQWPLGHRDQAAAAALMSNVGHIGMTAVGMVEEVRCHLWQHLGKREASLLTLTHQWG